MASELWGATMQEAAYQLAWAVLRKEKTVAEVERTCLHYMECVKYTELLDSVREILKSSLTPEELVAAASPLGDLKAPSLLSTIRAVFRKEFILNTDPEKKAWHAFTALFQRTFDPEGLTILRETTGRYGFWFEPCRPEGNALCGRLNSVIWKASREWDFAWPVPRRSSPPIFQDWDDETIAALVIERSQCCRSCKYDALASIPKERKVAQTLAYNGVDWSELD